MRDGDTMGHGDDDTAAARLGQLSRYFREPAVTGNTGRHTRSTTPAAPVNLTIVDHIQASIQEIAADARAVNPAAGPLPERVEAVYAWYLEHTKAAGPAQQQRRDTIVYRQGLEHAIALGDIKVVRPLRCPKCRTLGLMWEAPLRRALCTNRNCVTKDGTSTTWTLARLAYEHVAAEKTLQVRAT